MNCRWVFALLVGAPRRVARAVVPQRTSRRLVPTFATKFVVTLTLIALTGSAFAQNDVEGRNVIGYFTDWGIYANPPYDITNLPPAKLTHVNYAFAQIDSSNHVALYDSWADTDKPYPGDCVTNGCQHGCFNQITVFKQAHPGTKFLISIGGWTLSAPFYAVAADATKRATFAQSCADFLTTYPQFDGVDLDWEHPVIGGLQAGSAADAHNFTLLLQAIRAAIGPNKLLTIAVSANPTSIAALEYPQMAASVSWVNVMTYDFHGTWDSYVGHNSPLYNHSDPASSKFNLHDAVQAIIARGIASTQVCAGVPFYGPRWTNANSSNLWSSATGNTTYTYRDLVASYINTNGYVRYWDNTAKVPWLYNSSAKSWISYDDPQSVFAKGEYVNTNNLGGAMIWELSNDNAALLDALRAGMKTPVFRVTGVTNQAGNLTLTWQTRGGRTNYVEATSTFPIGFTNQGSAFIIPGYSDLTTNWTDSSALTNSPARIYRIRIAQ